MNRTNHPLKLTFCLNVCFFCCLSAFFFFFLVHHVPCECSVCIRGPCPSWKPVMKEMACGGTLPERDNELRWVLGELHFLFAQFVLSTARRRSCADSILSSLLLSSTVFPIPWLLLLSTNCHYVVGPAPSHSFEVN